MLFEILVSACRFIVLKLSVQSCPVSSKPSKFRF
uniref:Uncharacterized protein n=1 Tax=Anguilla anguilla TaxID=7936 RepID=A0A0E9XNV2_ANGAN